MPNLLLSTLSGLWACLVLPYGYDAPLSECAAVCQYRTDFSNDLPRLNLVIGDQAYADNLMRPPIVPVNSLAIKPA